MKKYIWLILILILILFFGVGFFLMKKSAPAQNMKEETQVNIVNEPSNALGKKAVIIVAGRDFKDEEYFATRQGLENAGIQVQVASDAEDRAFGVDGAEIGVDLALAKLEVSDFDAVVFIGGPGAPKHLDNETSHKIAQEALKEGKVLGAICISPTILAKAGVLRGKKATVWSSAMYKKSIDILQENGAFYQQGPVVRDGLVLTANGPAAAREFGKTLAQMIAEISSSD